MRFASGCIIAGALALTWFKASHRLYAPAQVEITVHVAHTLGVVNRNIFGNNINWVQDASNMWDIRRHAFYPESAAAIRDLHAPFIRYPGGLYGNFFHWTASLPANRRMQRRQDSKKWEMPTFGILEFYEASERFGFQPMYIFNLSTGTPNEAASLVAYLNGATTDLRLIGSYRSGTDWHTVAYWAKRRAADGHPAAFNARYFELGNENWNTAEMGGQTVNDYVRAAVATDIAVKRIDPTIRTAAVAYHLNRPGVVDAAAGSTTSWNDAMLNGLQRAPGHMINAIVNHYYTSGQGISPPSRYAAEVLSDSRPIEAGLNAFILNVHQKYSRQPTEIWWTEWARAAVAMNDHNLQDALYAADIGLNTYGLHPEITIGNYFTMGDGGRGLFFAGDGIHRPLGTVVRFPEFEVVSLIARMLTGERVLSETHAPAFDRPDRGNPSQVRVLAALDRRDKTLRLFIVNMADHALPGTIMLHGCEVHAPIRIHQVGGSGLNYESNNSEPDAPHRVADVQRMLSTAGNPLKLEIPGPAFVVLEIPIASSGK